VKTAAEPLTDMLKDEKTESVFGTFISCFFFYEGKRVAKLEYVDVNFSSHE